MSISTVLDTPFYAGAVANTLTPLPYPVSINGRGYVPDFSFPLGRRLAYSHQSIDMLRPQSDVANIAGEQSLNPEGLWRRTQTTWHKGAGQAFFDDPDSDAARFSTSTGVNPWTKGQLSLLGDTTLQRASAFTNLYMVVAGADLYITDNQTLAFSTTAAPTVFTVVTGTPAVAATSLCADGFNVYAAFNASGLYTTTRGAAAATQLVTSALAADTVVRYVKGRLMLSKGASIYNITSSAPAALPAALFTQANTDFKWVDFAEGPSNIYMAGYSGDRSLIYRTAVITDGTTLAAPQIAGELPSGEVVTSLKGYLGNLLIGSNKGIRFCALDTNGNIVVGDLIACNTVGVTPGSVLAIEAQDRFVWFGGWVNVAGTNVGLGRLDLRTFNSTTPAYASDLMGATDAGALNAVNSIVTFGGRTWFSTQAVGFYQEQTVKVASGTVTSGRITYGIADQKVPVFLRVNQTSLVGTIASSLALDGGSFTVVGSALTAGTTTEEYSAPQTLSNFFEVQHTLTRASGADTTGPVLTHYTLRANPAASTGFEFHIPIRLHTKLLVGGVEVACVPSQERAFLDALRTSRQVVPFQEASTAYTVTVEALHWLPESIADNNRELNGVLVVGMKTLA